MSTPNDDTSPTGLLLDVPLRELRTADVLIVLRRQEGRIIAGASRWRRIRVEATTEIFGDDEANVWIARDFAERDDRDLSQAGDDADNWAAVMAEALQLAADHYKREAQRWAIPPG